MGNLISNCDKFVENTISVFVTCEILTQSLNEFRLDQTIGLSKNEVYILLKMQLNILYGDSIPEKTIMNKTNKPFVIITFDYDCYGPKSGRIISISIEIRGLN